MEKMFQMLKQDHKKVAGVIQQMMEAEESERKELLDQLKEELTIHMKLEEKLLYPMLKNSDETHDQVLESYEEHREVKHQLGLLEKTPLNAENWEAVLTVLKENIEHHVKEEERQVFKLASQVLDPGMLSEMTKKMETEKQKHMH